MSNGNYVHRALALFDGYADAEALVAGDRRLSYADVRGQVLALAGQLTAHGVRPGAGVAVQVDMPIEAPMLQLALHLLGCRTVWLALGTPRDELHQFLRDAAPDLLLYDARGQTGHLGPDDRARLGIPLLCLGPGGEGPDLLDPTALTDAVGGQPVDLSDVASEPASVFQTSGTTGAPKLVHLEHGFFHRVLEMGEGWVPAGRPVLRHLALSPFWHVSGQITGLLNLFMGGLLVIQEGWDIPDFLDTIARERINSTFVSPPMLYQILDHPALADADLSSMVMFNVGGAPAAPNRIRQAIERCGPVLRIVYGLSESTVIAAYPAMTYDPRRPDRLGSCGVPYGDVDLQIRDATGAVLGPGEPGEIWVRGRLTFAGYWGRPDLTAQTLVDGWLKTRDLGYQDPEGYLYLVGRADDLIITGTGARNVYPRPIEDALAGHPAVHAAVVIGVPDQAVGEAVHAFVVRQPGAQVTAEELIERVQAVVTPGWAPRAVEFVDALPLTGTNKVDRQALRRQYEAAHAVPA